MADRPWIRAASSSPVPANARPGVRGGGVRAPGVRAPAAASPTPRIYNPPRTFASTVGSPASAGIQQGRGYGSPAYGAPRAGAPVSNGPRVYNYNQPTRGYGAPPTNNVRVYSPPPRTFAQPPAQRPAQSFHPAYTPPPSHFSQPHNFSAPAPSFGGGGFGHAGGGGGGMHFGGGGGGRRR
jgi:hypothetical protein